MLAVAATTPFWVDLLLVFVGSGGGVAVVGGLMKVAATNARASATLDDIESRVNRLEDHVYRVGSLGRQRKESNQ